jgi:general secretion pathway protein G
LVELLVVVVLVAILALIAVPKFMESGQRGREAALHADLKLYRNAIELYVNDTGLYPTTMADLTALTAPATGTTPGGADGATLDATLWFGPYLYSVPPDPTAPLDAWTYTSNAGTIFSSNPGTGLDGTAYTTW